MSRSRGRFVGYLSNLIGELAGKKPRRELTLAGAPTPNPTRPSWELVSGPEPTMADLAAKDAVVMLDVDHVDVWPHNPRKTVDFERITELVAVLSGPGGQRDAVHAIPDLSKAGYYLVVDGKRRLLAIRQGRLQGGLIKAVVHHDITDPLDLLSLAVSQNESYDPLTALDLAFSCRHMLDAQPGTKAEALALAIRRDSGTVSKLLAIARLPESVVEVLRIRPRKFTLAFSYEIVYRVATNASTDAARALALEIVDKDLSLSKARALAEKALRGAPTRSRSTWDTHQFIVGDAEWGNMKTLAGHVKIELKGLPVDKIEQLRKNIEDMLR